MKKLILLLVVATFLVATGARGDVAPASQYLLWYLGNVMPTAPNSAGPGLSFTKQFPTAGGTIDGAVVDDPDAIDGKALYINDNSITDMVYYRSQPNNVIDSASGVTIVGRVKVTSDVHGPNGENGADLRILDNNAGSGLRSDYHWGGPNNNVRESIRGTGAAVAGNSSYHTLRLTAKGNGYGDDVPLDETFTYPDDTLVGQGADPYFWMGNADIGQINVVNNTVLVTGGDFSTNATYYVLCAPDGSGNITFEFDIQGTATTGGNIYYIGIYEDPGVAGRALAQWMGGATSIAGRMNYITTGAVLSANGLWDHCRVVANPGTATATFYFTPSGGTETTLGTQIIDARNTVYFINIWHYPRPDLAGGMAYFDNFKLNGTAVPVANPRTINLYLDENPTPVYTISPASPQAANLGNSFLGFGSASPEAQQEVYFDWVTASNRGAFAPGDEVAVLGHSLIPSATALTSIEQIKAAPLAPPAPVNIASSIVTGSFNDNFSTMVPVGFAIEEPTRHSGIRVVQDPASGPLACPKGADVSILGFAQTIGGERVIASSGVAINSYDNPVPPPLAMNQRASGGGQTGAQPPVWNPRWATEPFSYSDGALVGNPGWTGDATAAQIAVAGGELKVMGGPTVLSAIHTAYSAFGAAGFETTMNIRKGVGNSNIWRFYVNNSAGAELASWYGSGSGARPRIGGSVIPSVPLPDANPHKLGIKYTFATNTAEYFFDDVSKGTIVGTTGNNTLGSVQFYHYDQPTVPGDYAFFDDLAVDGFTVASPSVGLSNVGLLVKISGRVTEITPTSETGVWGWFRIEDGSGVNQTSASGVKCRVPEDDIYMMTVAVGDYIEATGVMGVENGLRLLWTTSYNKY